MNSLCRLYAAEKVLHLFNQKQPAAALKRSDQKILLQNISSQQHTYHARLKGLEAVIGDYYYYYSCCWPTKMASFHSQY